MMAIIDRRMDLPGFFFLLSSSSLPWEEAEAREPVDAVDPLRRKLKPGMRVGEECGGEWRSGMRKEDKLDWLQFLETEFLKQS